MTYSRSLGVAILVCALLGAAALVAAEFSTLYSVRLDGRAGTIQTALAGTHNSYSLIPLAVLAVILGLAALGGGVGRWLLGALMLVGVIALLIGLLHDLPDAHRTGLVGSLHSHWLNAASSPGAGMYLETLGAVLLIVAGGLGLLFGESAQQAPADDRPPKAGPTPLPRV